jgi:HD-GYP domain-containing protein (c-di-GMP phosphodiesterase class II)
MFEISLQHSIHTLEGTELVPAGVSLTEDMIPEIIASNSNPPVKSMSLMRFGSVKNDILDFFENTAYKNIFDNHEEDKDVLNVMEEMLVPIPVLEALDYFRKYDFYTYRHMLMVFALATPMIKMLFPDNKSQLHNAKAGPAHDLGKICVPLNILMKRDPLTSLERKVLFQHPAAGYVLLSYYTGTPADFSAIVARDHHERRDGSGYMTGVELNDPMVEIVAVADIYDALISPRPYRPVSFDNRTALEVMTTMAQQGQISWEMLKALIALNRKGKPDFRSFKVSLEKRGTPPPDSAYGKTAKS